MFTTDSRSFDSATMAMDTSSPRERVISEVLAGYERAGANAGGTSRMDDGTSADFLPDIEIFAHEEQAAERTSSNASKAAGDQPKAAEELNRDLKELDRQIEQNERDMQDYGVLGRIFECIASGDDDGARKAFEDYLNNIPPEERLERVFELQRKNSEINEQTGGDYEIDIRVEDGELKEVDMIYDTFVGPLLWIYGMYSTDLYDAED